MTITDLIDTLSLTSFTRSAHPVSHITDVYVSDLLSDVMGNAKDGCLWVTLQTHVNIVAVATMKNSPAVILVNGRKPDEETTKKADDEGIALLGTDLNAFELAGRLYNLLHG